MRAGDKALRNSTGLVHGWTDVAVPRMACAKNVLEEHDAVSEMKVGPSKPGCRIRFQTAVSCFSPKGCGGGRYGKSRGNISACMD